MMPDEAATCIQLFDHPTKVAIAASRSRRATAHHQGKILASKKRPTPANSHDLSKSRQLKSKRHQRRHPRPHQPSNQHRQVMAPTSNNGGDHDAAAVVAGGAHPVRTGMPAPKRHQQLKIPRLGVQIPRARANPGRLLTGISRTTAATLSRHKTVRRRLALRSRPQSIQQRTPGQRHQHSRHPMVIKLRPSPRQQHRHQRGTRPYLQQRLHPSRKRSPRNSMVVTVDAAGEFLPAARLTPAQSSPVHAQTRSCPHSKGPALHLSPG